MEFGQQAAPVNDPRCEGRSRIIEISLRARNLRTPHKTRTRGSSASNAVRADTK